MKRLFFNGTIITMTGEPCEAVLTQGERIIAAGALADLQAGDAERYDLRGGTLLPAFLDAHSHLSSYAASFLQVSLEGARSLAEIRKRLADFIGARPAGDTSWVLANAYDDSLLPEGERLDRSVLDEVSPSLPIVAQHKNGHNGVFNSAAAGALGFPAGDGVLAETAYMEQIKRVPMPGLDTLERSYTEAQERYLRYGITHIQEGILVKSMLPIYRRLIERERLFLDTVVYPDMETYDEFKALFPQAVGRYYRHMRLGGIKIILDGSPQTRTAWLQEPYLGTDERGSGTMRDGAVRAAVEKALAENVQLLAHCNGDRAIEQYLRVLEQFDPARVRQIRPVIIHAQLLRRDQLDRVKALGAIPSFFLAHVYHFGDIHLRNLGPDRAERISPARSALEKGIPFTFHQDTPVIEPDVLETVWCAVERRTKGGVLLGGEERIRVTQALRAQTANVAAQYGESGEKGSIAPGLRADLVVLDRDILSTGPAALRDARIVEVFHRGSPALPRAHR